MWVTEQIPFKLRKGTPHREIAKINLSKSVSHNTGMSGKFDLRKDWQWTKLEGRHWILIINLRFRELCNLCYPRLCMVISLNKNMS